MNNLLGVALCCGKVPNFGHHKYHVYNGVTMPGFGFFCDTCRKSASIISAGMCVNPVPHETIAFAAIHWNRKFMPWTKESPEAKTPTINAPAGYESAEIQWSDCYIGGCNDESFPFVLFKAEAKPHNPRKYSDGELQSLVLANVFGETVDLSELINRRNVSARLSTASWHGGNESQVIRTVRVSFYNAAGKHLVAFDELLKKLKIPGLKRLDPERSWK